MEVKKISSASAQEWEKALRDFPHSFFHTLDCITSVYKLSEYECDLYLFSMGKSAAAVPLIARKYIGKTDLVTPYGYSGIIFKNYTSEFLDNVYAYFESKNIVSSYISNHPTYTHTASLEHASFYKKNSSFVIDCSLGLGTLVENLCGSRKSQVKLKDGCEFIYEKEQLTDKFIELYVESMKMKSVSGFHLFSEETLNGLISSTKTFLIGVKYKGVLVSISLFGGTLHVCDFLLNGAHPNGRKYSSAILWEAVKKTKYDGIGYFNLGGGMHINDSLDQYKSRFGGLRMEFGAFKAVHDLQEYKVILKNRNIDYSDDYSGFFPIYYK